MMTFAQTMTAVSGLGSLVRAGTPLADAARRMGREQPEHEEMWSAAWRSLEGGRPLSEFMAEHWPEALVSALRAGEESGKLEDVLTQMDRTLKLQRTVRKTFATLSYPGLVAVGGFGVVLLYLVFVLPALDKAIPGRGDKGAAIELSLWVHNFFFANWAMALASAIVGTLILVSWLRSEEGKRAALAFALDVPVIGDALRRLFFGLWCLYMAMMARAGLPTNTGLALTASVLPGGVLRDSVEVFARDLSVHNRAMEDAADQEQLDESDPRQQWPFLVASAWRGAAFTGDVEGSLERVGSELIDSGMERLARFVKIATVIVTAVVAIMLVTPVGAYYLRFFSVIGQLGR